MRANWMEAVPLVLALVRPGWASARWCGPERMMVAQRNLPPFQVIDTADVRRVRTGQTSGSPTNRRTWWASSRSAWCPRRAAAERPASRIRYVPAAELRGRRSSRSQPEARASAGGGRHARRPPPVASRRSRTSSRSCRDRRCDRLNAAEAGDTVRWDRRAGEGRTHRRTAVGRVRVFIAQTVQRRATGDSTRLAPRSTRQRAVVEAGGLARHLGGYAPQVERAILPSRRTCSRRPGHQAF